MIEVTAITMVLMVTLLLNVISKPYPHLFRQMLENDHRAELEEKADARYIKKMIKKQNWQHSKGMDITPKKVYHPTQNSMKYTGFGINGAFNITSSRKYNPLAVVKQISMKRHFKEMEVEMEQRRIEMESRHYDPRLSSEIGEGVIDKLPISNFIDRYGMEDLPYMDNLSMPADFPDTRECVSYIIAASDSSDRDKRRADMVCSGADDDVQIQVAIDGITAHGEGGKIFLMGGDYNISTKIEVNSKGITIEGVGFGWYGGAHDIGSRLVAQTGLTGSVIEWNTGLYFGRLKGVIVYGKEIGGVTGVDILARDFIIENCVVHHCDTGIKSQNGDLYVINSLIENSVSYGIQLVATTSGFWVDRCIFTNVGAVDIRLYANLYECWITNNRFISSVNALHIDRDPTRVIFRGNIHRETTGSSYYFTSGADCDEIIIDGEIVHGNGVTPHFIEGDSTAPLTHATIKNCIVTGLTSTPFHQIDLSGVLFKDNIGLVDVLEIRDTIANILSACGGDVRGLWPFQDTSGTTIQDYSRNNHDLTPSEDIDDWDTIPTVGVKGRATYYTFNGTDEELDTPDHADFEFGNAAGDDDSAFSVICIISPHADVVASGGTLIGKYDEATPAREWIFRIDSNGYPEFELYDESADKYIGREDQTALTAAIWTILIATYDGSEASGGVKIYKDGAQVDDADHEDLAYVGMERLGADITFAQNIVAGPAMGNFYKGDATWFSVVGKELSANEAWIITQRLKGLLGI